jgi:hypothetical protein
MTTRPASLHPCVLGRTRSGATLYAALDVRAASIPPRCGIAAHSRAVARLAPFSDIDAACDALERLGCGPEPIGLSYE